MRHFDYRALTVCGLLASSALATPALAQTAPAPPLRLTLDDNGVDLVTGKFTFAMTEASIGSAGRALTLERYWGDAGWTDNWTGTLAYVHESGQTVVYVSLGMTSEKFIASGGQWVSATGSGATLTGDPLSGTFVYTGRDGTVITYSLSYDTYTIHSMTVYSEGGCRSANAVHCALPIQVKHPNGYTANLTWEVPIICTDWVECATAKMAYRLTSVADSRGYRFDIAYQTGGTAVPPASSWYRRTSVTFTNTKVAAPNTAVVTYAYPAAGVIEITTPGNRTWRFTGNLTGIRRPGSASDDISITYGAPGVASVTRDGVTTSYARSVAGTTATETVTNALNQQTVVVSNLAIGQPTSVKDPLNRITAFQYDGSGRLTRVTEPEGNYTQLTYDGRGNVTETRRVAKSGSGLADIVASASYPATCTNPRTCNQPASTTDALGNVTDYSYASLHGGVLSVTAPAPTTGAVRPEVRYAYTLTNGEYLPTGVSACQTGAAPACVGTADETKSSLSYDTNNNVVTAASGNGTGTLTATRTMTYDAIGNLLTLDGPLAGTADTTRYRYDAARQTVGIVGPDPDGGGALKHRAARVTYRPDGQVSKQELGTVNGTTDPDWAAFAAAETVDVTYDSNSRIATRKLSGTTGGAQALTQMSYDALGRPECAAVRMNPAIYGSLPSSACTLGTQGNHGPDRIAQTVYDAAGQVIENRVAVGTTDAATERTLTYTSNGMLATLKDAENNLTTFEYDGFDRLLKTRFPVTTQGANQSSTTDYEQLGYDAASNVTSFRNRGNQVIAFGYDNLGRQTSKDLPGSEPDVTYAYDNLGRLTSASQSGSSLSFTYDALGRNLTQVGPQGTVTSQWDLAGRRTRLTYPGSGLYVDYDHLVTGETTRIRENGASSGVGVLATYAYDNLGRRTSRTFGNGVAQAFAYDPISRLQQLTNDLSGTANDLSATFAYNPASQIASTTRTGDTYAWTGHFNQNTSSTVNGLNQIANYGAKTVSHDSKGNITAFGTKSFTYSSENLLLTGPASTTLAYDPVMRLRQTVSGATTLRFAYDGLDRIAEYNGSNTLQRRYVHGPGIDEPIVWYEGTGTTNRRFLSADERGSIVSVTDSSGSLLGINRYDEYGQPQSTNLGTWGYTGQAWLPNLNVWYYKARMYESEAGRFLQTDPIGYGPSPNLYAYVLNDPVNLIDPLGLCPFGQVRVKTGPATESQGPNGEIVVTQSSTCVPWDFLLGVQARTQLPGGGGGGGGGRGTPKSPQQLQPEPHKPPRCGASDDWTSAAKYVVDFVGTTADAAALGLGGAAVLTAPAAPVSGSFATGAAVAKAVSFTAGVVSAGISYLQGDYWGATGSALGATIGRKGAEGIQSFGKMHGVRVNPYGAAAGGTAASQAVSKGMVCPK